MGLPNSALWQAVEESCLRREAIARRSLMTVKDLGQVMRGKKNIGEDQKKRLALVLKKTVEELFSQSKVDL